MSFSATTVARAISQIVTLFGPEVLLSLLIAPRSRPSNSLQVTENLLLPSIEADAVHEPALRTVNIVAFNFDSDGVIIGEMQRLADEAVGVGDAANDVRLGFRFALSLRVLRRQGPIGFLAHQSFSLFHDV